MPARLSHLELTLTQPLTPYHFFPSPYFTLVANEAGRPSPISIRANQGRTVRVGVQEGGVDRAASGTLASSLLLGTESDRSSDSGVASAPPAPSDAPEQRLGAAAGADRFAPSRSGAASLMSYCRRVLSVPEPAAEPRRASERRFRAATFERGRACCTTGLDETPGRRRPGTNARTQHSQRLPAEVGPRHWRCARAEAAWRPHR